MYAASRFLRHVWQLSLILWLQNVSEKPPDGAHGCIRYMTTPPRLHHHVIQHSVSSVWFSSIQSESDGGPFSSARRDVASVGRLWEKEEWGEAVVNAQSWEEED